MPSLRVFRPWAVVREEGGAAIAGCSSGEGVDCFLDRAFDLVFVWDLVVSQ